MANDTVSTTDLLTDQLQLVEAHVNIFHESTDPEAVRASAAALMNTQAGRVYTAANPIAL